MAEEIYHPHDLMVRAVLSDVTEAASFLPAHLPDEVSQELNGSTLRLVEGSFVDEGLRSSEADLLYEVERVSSPDAIWLYILVEHQSAPDRWMRFRLLKYCCRIWGQSLRDEPEQRDLRAIVPLVFYQGERRWTYSREFADLFAESVRDWPGVPRFAHELLDQSGMRAEEVQGELKVRLMQLVMLAAYHPTLAWMEQAARLLGSLSSLGSDGGIDYVRLFVLYILSTQEPEAALSFREVLQRQAPDVEGDLMTYAQELLQEGRAEGQAEGEIKAEVRIIENLLREGMAWDAIERVTGIDEARFQALKRQVDAMETSPFNMCMAVAAPRLYAVATKNNLHVSEAKMRVICRRTGCSSSNSDVERASHGGVKTHPVTGGTPCGGGHSPGLRRGAGSGAKATRPGRGTQHSYIRAA